MQRLTIQEDLSVFRRSSSFGDGKSNITFIIDGVPWAWFKCTVDSFSNEIFDGLVNCGSLLDENANVFSNEYLDLFSCHFQFGGPTFDTLTRLCVCGKEKYVKENNGR